MDCEARVLELEARLGELATHLLPGTPYNTRVEAFTGEEIDRTRAYRVLAHAEIEVCLEDLARGVANDAYDAWFADRRPRVAVVALLAYSARGRADPPDELPLAGPADIAQRVKEAKEALTDRVEANNGVRDRNVLGLLMPVGLTEYDIDQTWLATIDSFGHLRGDTAHASAKRATNLPDPATELARVEDIVSGMKAIGVKLDSLQA